MRSIIARCTLLLIAATVLFALPAVATAQTATDLPYGTYSGTAVGSKTGGAAGKPIAVTIYVSEASGGQVELTVVTKKLPVPVSVKADASKVSGGWDIPVSVDMGSLRLSGSGVLNLREVGGKWVLYAAGSGTFRGSAGAGRAYAERVSAGVSAAEQVVGALKGFLSFGAPAEPARLEVPPAIEEAPPASVEATDGAEPGESGSDGVSDVAPPPTAAEILVLAGTWLLVCLFALFP